MQESRLFKNVLAVILLGLSQLAFAQVRVNLNNQYAVTFPSKPLKTKADSITTVYSFNNNGGFYIASVKDLSKMANYSSADSLKHFYDELIKTTVKKLNGKLSYQKDIIINGNQGIDFGYTIDSKTGFPDVRFQQSVYYNKTLYSFSFWAFKNKVEANTADKEIFFNTIASPTEEAPPAPYQVTAQAVPADSAKTPASQVAPNAAVNKLGYSVGYILGAVILTAFIIGLILLIRKSNKNK